ncbi:MAG: alanine racemase [Calditrichia bacterium]
MNSFKNTLEKITVPQLVLNEQICRRNIRVMAEKARRYGIRFRPHFKTHQSKVVGEWFKEEKVISITVSSLKMADYFKDNWDDITVAFPVNIREIDTINQIAKHIRLNLLVESVDSVAFLAQHVKYPIGCYIKVDSGYHRTGLTVNQLETCDRIVELIQKDSNMTLAGFLTHAGHSYHSNQKEEYLQIFKETVHICRTFRKRYSSITKDLQISYGDTPTCTMVEDLTGVDEIRPGNFVFYDLFQWYLGVCRQEQIAVVMACPVVARHEDRNSFIIYGGAVHFSKDSIRLPDGRVCYGLMVEWTESGWKPMNKLVPLISLSQEHGILQVDEELMKQIRIGDLVGILPVHSCLTADAMKGYISLEGRVLDHM